MNILHRSFKMIRRKLLQMLSTVANFAQEEDSVKTVTIGGQRS